VPTSKKLHATPRHITPHHTTPYHDVSCRIMPYRTMPCRAIPRLTTPGHTTQHDPKLTPNHTKTVRRRNTTRHLVAREGVGAAAVAVEEGVVVVLVGILACSLRRKPPGGENTTVHVGTAECGDATLHTALLLRPDGRKHSALVDSSGGMTAQYKRRTEPPTPPREAPGTYRHDEAHGTAVPARHPVAILDKTRLCGGSQHKLKTPAGKQQTSVAVPAEGVIDQGRLEAACVCVCFCLSVETSVSLACAQEQHVLAEVGRPLEMRRVRGLPHPDVHRGGLLVSVGVAYQQHLAVMTMMGMMTM